MSEGENGTSAPLVLGGNTGCGKTSLMHGFIKLLGKVESVSTAYVNCMGIDMDKPNSVFKSLIKQLFGKEEVVRTKPYDALTNKLKQSKKTHFIVLDELDQIQSK